jgi:hypothetical protein
MPDDLRLIHRNTDGVVVGSFPAALLASVIGHFSSVIRGIEGGYRIAAQRE